MVLAGALSWTIGGRLAVVYDVERQARLGAEQTTKELKATAEARDRTMMELEEAMRAREDFLSAVAHDLKNSLTSVQGFAQLLVRALSRLEMQDRERVVEHADLINIEAKRMVEQLDQLMAAARGTGAHQYRAETSPTDLMHTITRVAATVSDTEEHLVQVESDVNELEGLWDESGMDRVFRNVLSNAVKYSREGGQILMTVKKDTSSELNWAIMRIVDHGLGIPDEDLPMVFNRFYRGRNVADITSGSGLGLATCREIVEAHGGTIEVDSKEGTETKVIRPAPEAVTHK